MAITKLNLPPTQNEVIEKINEVIDGKQNTLVAGNCIELNQSILPEGYIKYDYLQGGNGAYIDLGIIPTCNVLHVRWKGQLLGSTYGGSFMGCVSGTTPRAGFRIFSNANNGEINLQSYSNLTSAEGGFNVSTVDVTYDNVNATISGTINNINVSQASATINTTLNKNMLLFAAYVGNSVGAASEQKCWELEIEKDGLLVSKLIPCQRVSDFEFGMYDIIRNTFLTNQGTGTFTAGNVVSDETYINFVNNNGFITKAVDDLTNYYTKSQTYTQTEVQQLIAAIPNFSVEVVQALPAEGEAMTLYLLPKTGTAPDVYEEYVWVTSSSSYELLGTTAVDLTGYLQTSDIVTTISTTSTDATIPSAKCVYDELSAKANNSDVIKKTGTAQQTITATNNTPLGLKTTDSSNTCYMSFNNNNGFRASLGVDNNRKLVFWDKSTLSTVAMTSNIPTIATTLTASSTNAKTVGAKCAYDALNLKQTKANLVTTISASSTDATYPSAKCVYDGLDGKQETLVSGTNIKTINNTSLLGSGNIEIQGGGATYKEGTDIIFEEIELDPDLPSEYTQVDGLHCSGSQYILTDYYPNNKTVLKGKARFDQKYDPNTFSYGSFSGYAFGATNSVDSTLKSFAFNGQAIWSSYPTNAYSNVSIYLYSYEFTPTSYTLNGITTSFSREIITSSYPLAIGGNNNQGTVENKLYGSIYPIEISENDVLVKKYIPCRRNSDDVLGLYETVSGTFLTNNGTGSFTGVDTQEGTKISFNNAHNFITDSYASQKYTQSRFRLGTIPATGTLFDGNYPSANAVRNYAQPKLISGENIKTLNGYSLLGSGDLLNNASSIGWETPVTISGISSGYAFLKCYANGEFICINGLKVFGSTDGINWTQKGTLPEASDPYDADWQQGCLVYGNGVYVAVDYYGWVTTSTDLETWTTPVFLGEVEPDYYGIGVENFSQLLFFNGNFHVFGRNGTGVSSDGVNWTISAPLSIVEDSGVQYFTYKGGTLIGTTGIDSSGICEVYKSTDYGSTWSSTPVEIEFPAEAEGNTLITTTDDKFVIVTSTGYTTTSEDGDTWEEPAYNDNLAPINNRLWIGLAYGNSKLVILSWRREVSIANVNAGKTIIIVNSYNNGTSFCDVYSDGKCVQGGIATGGTTNSGAEILFLKPFADDNYLLLASGLTRSKDNFGTYAVATAKVRNLSTTSFYASTSYRGASSSGAYQPYQFSWLAIGKIGSSS